MAERATFTLIERQVCQEFGITPASLWSDGLWPFTTHARHRLWVRVRNETGLSYTCIARESGKHIRKWHYSTVIKAVKKFERDSGIILGSAIGKT